MGKIYKTDGKVIATEPKNGKDYKLQELKDVVGGYIEIVPLCGGYIMVVNEEGKIHHLPYNQNATTILRRMAMHDGFRNDYICGDVLVCEKNQVQ